MQSKLELFLQAIVNTDSFHPENPFFIWEFLTSELLTFHVGKVHSLTINQLQKDKMVTRIHYGRHSHINVQHFISLQSYR